MAHAHKLPLKVLESVASHAANALANAERPDASLHESLPIWLLSREQLQNLRTRRAAGPVNLRRFLKRTPHWLHLLYRDGRPFGYVHGHHQPKGKHKVTNVSITDEAALVRHAIDQVDQLPTAAGHKAGILECPSVGLAGILLFPKKRQDELLICLFRDPAASVGWSPSTPIAEAVFIERLLAAHIIQGPVYKRPLSKKRAKLPKKRARRAKTVRRFL